MYEKVEITRLKKIALAAQVEVNDPSSYDRLVKNNLTSAIDIANWPKKKFTDFCENPVLFKAQNDASKFYDKAKIIAVSVGLTFLKVQQNCSPYLKNIAFQGPGTANDYPHIFGKLDYFFTDEFSSIFSPAAYFHDLLRIINDNDLIKISCSPDYHT
jgi:hypothetical protein